MTAPTSDLPTIADFLADATTRLEEATAILADRDLLAAPDPASVWTVPLDNAVHVLTRAVAALAAALRTLAEGSER